MKKLLALTMVLCMVFSIVACTPASNVTTTPTGTEAPEGTATPEGTTPTPATPSELDIFAMKGPTGIGMAPIFSDAAAGKTFDKYNFTIAANAQEKLSDLIAGNYDIASVPTNLAATLAKKAPGVYKIAAVNTLGVLYVLDSTDSIKSVNDLKGKKIYATGEGQVPQFALEYVLTKNGLKVGTDVEIEYLADASDVGKLVIAGSAEIAMLPQPYVTQVSAKAEKAKVALDITEEWDKVAEEGSRLMTSCVLVNAKTYENDKEAVERFMEEFRKSVKFVNENTAEAAKNVVEAGIVADAGLAEKAIPKCNIVCIEGEEMKTSLKALYEAIFAVNSALVGGQVPSDDIYLK
ncbi:MAG: ABC transporter substrate-binding protein [Ruminococcaceae bacterium]|nr:ABC transporter substrate-binding protein [Oscillospiraceae bacterium]